MGKNTPQGNNAQQNNQTGGKKRRKRRTQKRGKVRKHKGGDFLKFLRKQKPNRTREEVFKNKVHKSGGTRKRRRKAKQRRRSHKKRN